MGELLDTTRRLDLFFFIFFFCIVLKDLIAISSSSSRVRRNTPCEKGEKNDISCQAEKTRARIGRRGKKKQTRKKQKTFSEKGIGITKFNFGERGKRAARQKKELNGPRAQ